MKDRNYSIYFNIIFLLLLFTGCTGEPKEESFSSAVTSQAVEEYIDATQTKSESVTKQAETSIASTATPTPDKRLKPEDWQEWPIIPEVTETAKEIYFKGLAMGNDPHAFSKVGDCQNIKQAFLGFFDSPDGPDGGYNLKGDTFLQETIDQFSGYFNRDGEATRYGFNAAAVLSPMWADPDICLPDETPLECELRITRPMFVLISLEFPFLERTPEVYERYIRQIIEYTISQGAVPILATKADNVEGDHSINLTTAKLAYEYDLPLWNFWAKMAEFPDHGIDQHRDDMAFHIFIEHWNTRSFSFLRVLDHLWQELSKLA